LWKSKAPEICVNTEDYLNLHEETREEDEEMWTIRRRRRRTGHRRNLATIHKTHASSKSRANTAHPIIS